MIGIDDILAARECIAPYVHRTPLWYSRTLSRVFERDVYLKAELFQKTGSFKPRGILNRLHGLGPAERRAGVITFSVGNAAQALAYASSVLGVRSTVVMPVNANPTKVQATRDYGAEVVLHGTTAEALDRCTELARERGLTYVSSYDEPVIAGHGSLGLEILDDLPDVGAVIAGVGGGGLVAGIALALRGRKSGARVVGVEPEGAPTMYRSLRAGQPVRLESVNTIADGLAAPTVGEHSYAAVRQHVDDIVLVSDEQIREAMRLLMERCKLVVEPAGAAPVAGLSLDDSPAPRGVKVVCVLSGGNIDLSRLKHLF